MSIRQVSYRRIAPAGACATSRGLAVMQQQPRTSATNKINSQNPSATEGTPSSYRGNRPAIVEVPCTTVSHLRATSWGGNAFEVALATENQPQMRNTATKGREVSSNDSESEYRTSARSDPAVGQVQIPASAVPGDYTRACVGEKEITHTSQQSAKETSARNVSSSDNVDGGNKSHSVARDIYERQQLSVAAKVGTGQLTVVNNTQSLPPAVANAGNSKSGNKSPIWICPRPMPPATASIMTPGTTHPVRIAEPSSTAGKTGAAVTVTATTGAISVTRPRTLSVKKKSGKGYDMYGFRDPGQVQKRRALVRLAKADIGSVRKTNEFQRADHALQHHKIQHAQTMAWCYSIHARVQSASQAASAVSLRGKTSRVELETARLDKFNSEVDVRDADAYLRLSRSRLAEATTRLLCEKVGAKQDAKQALCKYDRIEDSEDEDEPPLIALEKYCRTMEEREKGVILVEKKWRGEAMAVDSAVVSLANVSRKRSRIDETIVTLDGTIADSSTKDKDCCNQSRRPMRKVLTQGDIDEALTNGRKAETAIKEAVTKQGMVNRATEMTKEIIEHSPEETRRKGHERRHLLYNLNAAKHVIEATQRHIWGLSKAAACASMALDMARKHPKVVVATARLSAAEQALETAKKNNGPAQLWLKEEIKNEKRAWEWENQARKIVEQAWNCRETARVQSEKARQERDTAAAEVDALPEEIRQGFQTTPQNLFNLMEEESYCANDGKV